MVYSDTTSRTSKVLTGAGVVVVAAAAKNVIDPPVLVTKNVTSKDTTAGTKAPPILLHSLQPKDIGVVATPP